MSSEDLSQRMLETQLEASTLVEKDPCCFTACSASCGSEVRPKSGDLSSWSSSLNVSDLSIVEVAQHHSHLMEPYPKLRS